MINNIVLVLGVQQSDSVIHTNVSVVFHILFMLLQNPEQNSLYYTVCMHAKLFQSCPTLCDPMDCSPPGSSDHELLQARMLEWVAMPSSNTVAPH